MKEALAGPLCVLRNRCWLADMAAASDGTQAPMAFASPPSVPPARPKVLIVDDEPAFRQVLQIAFQKRGFDVALAPGVQTALEAVEQHPTPFPLVLTDLVMPDGSGMDVLSAAKARSQATEVIVMTAHSTRESALEAMRRGAYDFVTKPFSMAEICTIADKALEKSSLITENRQLKARLEHFVPSERVPLAISPSMQGVADLISKAAAAGKTRVLITGESGVGKERVARAVHDQSERADKPFLVVNCAAIPETLMESELFGHEKGSFTGAAQKHLGMFRAAEGGTLLLDEVGELVPAMQVKLLRVLQERKVRPVGGPMEIPVDVRVLAATNRDLESDVRTGKFRQDLYYRLNVLRIEIPPLRNRQGDIPYLAERFVKRFSAEQGKDVRGLAPDALRALYAYSFPGNVRELENIIERAVALASGPAIGLGDLPAQISGLSAGAAPALAELPPEGCNLDEVLGEVERRLILQALDRTNGVRKNAAKLLGITFRSLRYRLAKHALADDEENEGGSDEPADQRSGPP